ncbi:MAG: ArgE/DapE family deacylase [Candidatus Limnocylindrales bacterium]
MQTGAALSERERRLVAAVDPGRLEADLRSVVAVPSVTGDDGPIQDLMAALVVDAGLALERVETDPAALARDPDFPGIEVPRDRLPVVAGRLRGARPGPRLLVVAHVDVVPPGDPTTWTTPAFEPDVRDGDLYGRGANDMKGGLISALAALRALAAVADPAELAGDAVFVAVPSEEDGGAGMLAAIRAGYTGDQAVITEPTDLQIVVTQAGAITFRLTVPGRAAHASMRREGVSALEKLEVLHAALRADEHARNDAERDPRMRAIGLPYPTIIGRVSGGDWASTVPDRIVAEGRYGVRAGQTADEAEADLQRCIDDAWESDPFLRQHQVGLEVFGGRFDSAHVDPDGPLATGLRATAADVDGIAPAFIGVPYGADMRLLVNEGATPTVIYGPGDPRYAHAADERVSLDQVVRCASVLAVWLDRRLRESPEPR